MKRGGRQPERLRLSFLMHRDGRLVNRIVELQGFPFREILQDSSTVSAGMRHRFDVPCAKAPVEHPLGSPGTESLGAAKLLFGQVRPHASKSPERLEVIFAMLLRSFATRVKPNFARRLG